MVQYGYDLTNGYDYNLEDVLEYIRKIRETTDPEFCEGFMRDGNTGYLVKSKWVRCHEDMKQLSLQLPYRRIELTISIVTERISYELHYEYNRGRQYLRRINNDYDERMQPKSLLLNCIRALVQVPRNINFGIIPEELHQKIFEEIGRFSLEHIH